MASKKLQIIKEAVLVNKQTISENYRIAAQHGIGAETPKTVKKGADVDYYHPKTGDKHYGKITSVTPHGYSVKDHKTKEVHKFEYWNEDRYKAKVKYSSPK